MTTMTVSTILPAYLAGGLRLFGLTIPGYTSPSFQLVLAAFVCFLCPGMFNALGGLGGGGKTVATLADNMVRRDFRGI
jgi:hypothetical protein